MRLVVKVFSELSRTLSFHKKSEEHQTNFRKILIFYNLHHHVILYEIQNLFMALCICIFH
jgi:hypothetical protein